MFFFFAGDYLLLNILGDNSAAYITWISIIWRMYSTWRTVQGWKHHHVSSPNKQQISRRHKIGSNNTSDTITFLDLFGGFGHRDLENLD